MSAAMWGHGLSAREQEIMDLYDSGLGAAAIAAQLGVARSYIEQTIRFYSQTGFGPGGFDAMVRRGTLALANAIAASGGRFA